MAVTPSAKSDSREAVDGYLKLAIRIAPCLAVSLGDDRLDACRPLDDLLERADVHVANGVLGLTGVANGATVIGIDELPVFLGRGEGLPTAKL